tara:strand:- start:14787 stop:14936 length:150 start_codon:yes stop_codon:yes gene_type:complete
MILIFPTFIFGQITQKHFVEWNLGGVSLSKENNGNFTLKLRLEIQAQYR